MKYKQNKIKIPTIFEQQRQVAAKFKDILNSLLENDTDIEVNSVDELEDKFKELTNPYRNLPEIKENVSFKQSTSADGWKYAKRK